MYNFMIWENSIDRYPMITLVFKSLKEARSIGITRLDQVNLPYSIIDGEGNYHGFFERAEPSLVPSPGLVKPQFSTWAEFLSITTTRERIKWCRMKANKANQPRLMSGSPENILTADDVWQILESAQGRCRYCGSLAVEKAPYLEGKKVKWSYMGRRIGSIDHVISRFAGGSNKISNLQWCCLWCNTWKQERIKGAPNHGGLYEPLKDNVKNGVPTDGPGPFGQWIKGNTSKGGKLIYHVPGGRYYDTIVPKQWFYSREDAERSGYRLSQR